MDGIIQMLPQPLRKFSTHIDFEGQLKAERIYQIVLVAHGIIGFIAGYATQQLSVTMYSVGVGFLIASLLVLPPWPMFRRHPLKWQPNVEEMETQEKETPKPAPSAKKESKKKR